MSAAPYCGGTTSAVCLLGDGLRAEIDDVLAVGAEFDALERLAHVIYPNVESVRILTSFPRSLRSYCVRFARSFLANTVSRYSGMRSL